MLREHVGYQVGQRQVPPAHLGLQGVQPRALYDL
jgi:hypothetical protein